VLLAGCSRPASLSSSAQAHSDTEAPPIAMVAPKLARPAVVKAMPDRLVMPAINIDTPVVELGWSTSQSSDGQIFSEWEVAEYAAGWHKNSALLSEGGNVVMSGHNNILGSVFRELDQLKQGDQITVWAGDQSFIYQVDRVMIVPESMPRSNSAKTMPSGLARSMTVVSPWLVAGRVMTTPTALLLSPTPKANSVENDVGAARAVS